MHRPLALLAPLALDAAFVAPAITFAQAPATAAGFPTKPVSITAYHHTKDG